MHISNLYKWSQPHYVSDSMATYPSTGYLIPEPYGLVLIIGTWNFPLLLSLGPLIGALSTGNTVIVKFSNETKETASLLCELSKKYLNQTYSYYFIYIIITIE